MLTATPFSRTPRDCVTGCSPRPAPPALAPGSSWPAGRSTMTPGWCCDTRRRARCRSSRASWAGSTRPIWVNDGDVQTEGHRDLLRFVRRNMTRVNSTTTAAHIRRLVVAGALGATTRDFLDLTLDELRQRCASSVSSDGEGGGGRVFAECCALKKIPAAHVVASCGAGRASRKTYVTTAEAVAMVEARVTDKAQREAARGILEFPALTTVQRSAVGALVTAVREGGLCGFPAIHGAMTSEIDELILPATGRGAGALGSLCARINGTATEDAAAFRVAEILPPDMRKRYPDLTRIGRWFANFMANELDIEEDRDMAFRGVASQIHDGLLEARSARLPERVRQTTMLQCHLVLAQMHRMARASGDASLAHHLSGWRTMAELIDILARTAAYHNQHKAASYVRSWHTTTNGYTQRLLRAIQLRIRRGGYSEIGEAVTLPLREVRSAMMDLCDGREHYYSMHPQNTHRKEFRCIKQEEVDALLAVPKDATETLVLALLVDAAIRVTTVWDSETARVQVPMYFLKKNSDYGVVNATKRIEEAVRGVHCNPALRRWARRARRAAVRSGGGMTLTGAIASSLALKSHRCTLVSLMRDLRSLLNFGIS